MEQQFAILYNFFSLAVIEKIAKSWCFLLQPAYVDKRCILRWLYIYVRSLYYFKMLD
jgi:hypothetical protein